MTELVTTNFTKKHSEIAHDLIERLVSILKSQETEVKSYQIDTDVWGQENEGLKLKFGEANVTISITTKK